MNLHNNIKLCLLSSLFLLILLMPVVGYTKESNSLEEKLKAVYLVRLGEFITWPDALEKQAKFTICIADNEAIYAHLKSIANYTVKGKPLLLIHSASANKNCHILYTNTLNKTDIFSNTLIVGNHESVLQQGGNIRFYVKENKIRMQVNLKTSQKKGLTISSKLLRLMEIIEQ